VVSFMHDAFGEITIFNFLNLSSCSCNLVETKVTANGQMLCMHFSLKQRVLEYVKW
jgi:hypothetical protein